MGGHGHKPHRHHASQKWKRDHAPKTRDWYQHAMAHRMAKINKYQQSNPSLGAIVEEFIEDPAMEQKMPKRMFRNFHRQNQMRFDRPSFRHHHHRGVRRHHRPHPRAYYPRIGKLLSRKEVAKKSFGKRKGLKTKSKITKRQAMIKNKQFKKKRITKKVVALFPTLRKAFSKFLSEMKYKSYRAPITKAKTEPELVERTAEHIFNLR